MGNLGFGSVDDPRPAGVVLVNVAREFIVPRLLISGRADHGVTYI